MTVDVNKFVQTLVDGLSNGAIYASLALALVLVHRATHIPNFAQGELAMLAAFIAWEIQDRGAPWIVALLGSMAISFLIGYGIERGVVRWVEGASPLTLLIVTLGLLSIINSGAGWYWGFLPKAAESPFPTEPIRLNGGEIILSWQTVGIVIVLMIVMAAIFVMFNKTKLGLGLRGAAGNPSSAKLVGIGVGTMLAMGWGLAALVGSAAGVMVAPKLGLQPNMMATVMIFAFAGAVLGGFDSPPGAVVRRVRRRAAAVVHGHVLAAPRQPAQPGPGVLGDHARPAVQTERDLRQGGGVTGMRRQWIIGIVVSLFAISLTWIVTDVRLYQFATATSLAIAMLGLNMLTGYNGQISLGHGVFMGLGAYTGAILVRDQGMSYPLVIVVAFVVCFVFGGAGRPPGAAVAGDQPGADHAGAGAGVPAGAQEVRLRSAAACRASARRPSGSSTRRGTASPTTSSATCSASASPSCCSGWPGTSSAAAGDWR